MSKDIRLKILTLEKSVADEDVYRVVLPYDDKTLTVIQGRAPTLLYLEMGRVQVLDESGRVVKEYVITGGAADVKENTCTILTEAAFDKGSLTMEQVRAMNEEFQNPFYSWLLTLFEQEEKTGKAH